MFLQIFENNNSNKVNVSSLLHHKMFEINGGSLVTLPIWLWSHTVYQSFVWCTRFHVYSFCHQIFKYGFIYLYEIFNYHSRYLLYFIFCYWLSLPLKMWVFCFILFIRYLRITYNPIFRCQIIHRRVLRYMEEMSLIGVCTKYLSTHQLSSTYMTILYMLRW